MQGDRRHLHELEPGQPFRMPASGRVSRLVRASAGQAEIDTPGEPEDVSFETHEGDTVEFTRPTNGSEPCAPTMEVEVL